MRVGVFCGFTCCPASISDGMHFTSNASRAGCSPEKARLIRNFADPDVPKWLCRSLGIWGAHATKNHPVFGDDEKSNRAGRRARRVFIAYSVHPVRRGAATLGTGGEWRRQWPRGAPGRESRPTPPRGRSAGPGTTGAVCLPGHFGENNSDVHTGTSNGCSPPGSRTSERAIRPYAQERCQSDGGGCPGRNTGLGSSCRITRRRSFGFAPGNLLFPKARVSRGPGPLLSSELCITRA